VLFREIETAGGSRVETFLALLFLSHRGQVRLQQDELFGDLWVRNPAAVGEAKEAIAD
jgi:segregation and condensation protein A